MARVRGGSGEQPGIQAVLRRLPSVEELLQTEAARALTAQYPRERVVDALREAVAQARADIVASHEDAADPDGFQQLVEADTLASAAGRLLAALTAPHLRRVVNASGVVVHTNLGRSLLAERAVERVVEVARHYSNLEYDLEEGVRGSRDEHVEALLTRLTGAEAAFVVNNNAGAVLLLLMALAAGREVLVSRGPAGGDRRVLPPARHHAARAAPPWSRWGPPTAPASRTTRGRHHADTALLLRVHTSNFRIVGFTEEVERRGAGRIWAGAAASWWPTTWAAAPCPTSMPSGTSPRSPSSLGAGADVVCFSGDKLLGGPQAGILVGRRGRRSRRSSAIRWPGPCAWTR